MEKRIVTEDVKKDLRENFKHLREPVAIHVFTKEGVNDQYNKIAKQLISEIAAVDERLSVEFHNIGDSESDKYGVKRSPSLLIAPEKYRILFTGTPLGEEGRTLVLALVLASVGSAPMLKPEFANRLQDLRGKRDVRVFVSPT